MQAEIDKQLLDQLRELAREIDRPEQDLLDEAVRSFLEARKEAARRQEEARRELDEARRQLQAARDLQARIQEEARRELDEARRRIQESRERREAELLELAEEERRLHELLERQSEARPESIETYFEEVARWQNEHGVELLSDEEAMQLADEELHAMRRERRAAR